MGLGYIGLPTAVIAAKHGILSCPRKTLQIYYFVLS
jgi:hypothetical protein